MTITLEAIEAEHSRISALIEEFRKQPRASEYRIAAATIPLAAGERLAGSILNDDGTLKHYLILLPGEAESVEHKAAMTWADKLGGSLPTRQEQALLYANLKHEFAEAYYWSCETHESDSGWAWGQGFGYGSQTSNDKGSKLRARRCRRVIVQGE